MKKLLIVLFVAASANFALAQEGSKTAAKVETKKDCSKMKCCKKSCSKTESAAKPATKKD